MGLTSRLQDPFGTGGSRAPDAAVGRIVANRLKTLMPVVSALSDVAITPAEETLRSCRVLLDQGVDSVMEGVPEAPAWVRGELSKHVGDMLATAIRVRRVVPSWDEFEPFVRPIAEAIRVNVTNEQVDADRPFLPYRIAESAASVRLASPIEHAIVRSRNGFAADPFRPVPETLKDSLGWIRDAGDRALERALGGIATHELSHRAVLTLRESFHRAASRIFLRSLEHNVETTGTEFARAWSSLDRAGLKQWWPAFKSAHPDGVDLKAVTRDAEHMWSRLLSVVDIDEPHRQASADEEPAPAPAPPPTPASSPSSRSPRRPRKW